MSITLQELSRLIAHQLPSDLSFDRLYQAMEGDLRIIAKDSEGREYRFTVTSSPQGIPTLKAM